MGAEHTTGCWGGKVHAYVGEMLCGDVVVVVARVWKRATSSWGCAQKCSSGLYAITVLLSELISNTEHSSVGEEGVVPRRGS